MKKIYVFCPAKIVSGGPEALHQLVDAVNALGGDGFIVYTDGADIKTKSVKTPFRYRRYKTPQATLDTIVFNPENIFVVPESIPQLIDSIPRGVKCLWWLSVGFKQDQYNYKALSDIIHLYQSEHARLFVEDNINPKQIYPPSDYVVVEKAQQESKRDEIALVERKLDNRLKPLVEALKSQFKVTVISGLSRFRLGKLLARTKVFIDFGSHPGKDRLPREAAINGNVILTSSFGASSNHIDVPISTKYKVSAATSIKEISALLDQCLASHTQCLPDFQLYREGIQKEKNVFFIEVDSLFELRNSDDSIQDLSVSHNLAGSSFAERLMESAVLIYCRRIIEYIRIKVFNN